MTCDNCKQPTPRRTQVGDLWVCAACVPDDIYHMYPKSYKEHALATLKRSQQARKNFGKEQHA